MKHQCASENCCGKHNECCHRYDMNISEAAAYLSMHTKTLTRLAKDGLVPAKKINDEWKFSKESLDNWLEQALL